MINITTKSGDDGFTVNSLNELVEKTNPVIEFLGQVDLFIAQCNAVRVELPRSDPRFYTEEVLTALTAVLKQILCSYPPKKVVSEDFINEYLDCADHFLGILDRQHFGSQPIFVSCTQPVGVTPISAKLNVLRALMRQLEIKYLRVSEQSDPARPFFNRASDHLYILTRIWDVI